MFSFRFNKEIDVFFDLAKTRVRGASVRVRGSEVVRRKESERGGKVRGKGFEEKDTEKGKGKA